MKKFLTLLFLTVSFLSFSQDIKYMSVANGISNRRVYSIEKDDNGYMWFLTQEGIDRFNGSDFKNYKLFIQNKEVPISFCLKHLIKDYKNQIWEITRQGQLFKYNILLDKFQLYINLKDSLPDLIDIQYSFVDKNNDFWLCGHNQLYIFNPQTREIKNIETSASVSISYMVQIAPACFLINTSRGIYMSHLIDNTLELSQPAGLRNFYIEASCLFYDEATQQLLIGSSQQGIFVYNVLTSELFKTHSAVEETNINCIYSFNEEEVIIGTETAGVYKMNLNNYTITPYLTSELSPPFQINGNNIKDIYVDEEKRVWMANYPIGIAIFDHRYPPYQWIQHSPGNKNSLANNQVNYILEDSERDIWYATNNGISIYHTKAETWTNLLGGAHQESSVKRYHFSALCEISPGKVLAGGYMGGVYLINKHTLTTEYLFYQNGIETDKCTHSLFKDSQNRIWLGGEHYLKYIDFANNRIETIVSNLSSINVIIEKDSSHLWIGSNEGLFLVNKPERKIIPVKLRIPTGQINTLYQNKEGILYIGTNNMGLIQYNPSDNKTLVFDTHTSNLISNTIHCILPQNKHLIVSTEDCITYFNTRTHSFRNWTKDRGLVINHFNPGSGILTSRETCIFGSGEGAIEFSSSIQIPTEYKNKLVFSDFQLFYEPVFPGEKDSPLQQDINEVKELYLDHNQNLFSISLSSINYDCPSNILYSWKLEGFYNEWNRPTSDKTIRFTNLNPGRYTLRVRAISNEDWHVIEERSLDIIIKTPFWATTWAKLAYLLIFIGVTWFIIRHSYMRKESKISNEKIEFFINTAHDIRTPLTLIKAPLDELLDKEELSVEGEYKLMTAIRNTNSLYKLINNLINFEKTNIYSYQLCVEEFELYSFLEETLRQFKPLAQNKRIQLQYEANFSFQKVWFDKAKMDSILKNLISNAIKYTPEGGEIRVIATTTSEGWTVEIKDTGIGIPGSEQDKLFNLFFRGSNAINLQIPGSGIGLLLVKKQIQQLKGKIRVKTAENAGSSFKISFRHGKNMYKKKQLKENQSSNNGIIVDKDPIVEPPFTKKPKEIKLPKIADAPTVMIVDDNEEIREFLGDVLSSNYKIVTANNGKEAKDKIRKVNPNLLILDIMMPEMRGDQLCRELKEDINTSHIPIILISALGDRDDIIEGLTEAKADEYFVKPFDIKILQAKIAKILENRVFLAEKLTNMDIQEVGQSESVEDLDMEFMRKVKENIEENMEKPAFNIDTLCYDLHMSRSSFYNKIKALTHMSPAEFIKIQKMNKAAQLLKTKKYTMTEIADKVGYSDAKYFRKVFKDHFKMTPSQYINENEE